MRKIFAIILFASSTIATYGQKQYLSTDFNRGIPADYTLICNDNMPVASKDYNRLSAVSTWFTADVAGADGKVAVSASRREPADAPTDNWLITPRMHIASANAWLRWDARSVHHDLRDGYTVMVSATDMTGFKPLLTVDKENYTWTTHIISLADYEGKDVMIGINHNSTNKFLLAIDNLFAGEPTDFALTCKNTSPHFAGNEGTASMTGTITNTGRTINMKEFTLTTNQGQTYTMPCSETIATGQSTTYSIDIPVETGNTYRYTIKAVEADGTAHNIASDIVACSNFPRTMLIEKFTGLWCNSCTAAAPAIYAMEERLGKDAAIVEVHGYSSSLDPMSNDAYAAALNVKAYPTILYNRDADYKQDGAWNDITHLENAMAAPTDGYIEAEAAWTDESHSKIAITSRSQFAADLDNAINKYRVGYIFKEETVPNTTPYPQGNNCSLLSDQEFRYLPTQIPAEMLTFHNLARGGETTDSYAMTGGAVGFKGSLPMEIKAGQVYEVNDTIDIPATIADKAELKVIAVLYKSSLVMNVSQIDEIALPSAIAATQKPGNNGTISITQYANGQYKATLPQYDNYTINIYNTAGTNIATHSGTGSECLFTLGNNTPGCYIIRISQNGIIKTTKIINTKNQQS